MFAEAIAVGRVQAKIKAAGYCSLCGTAKATTSIGNRQICEACKKEFGISPAPDMWIVFAQEKKANDAFEKMMMEVK